MNSFVIKSTLGFCLIMLFSCSSSSNSNELLDEEKMTEVLQEVMLLENYYQTKYGSPSVYKAALDSSVEVVFKKYQTNKNAQRNYRQGCKIFRLSIWIVE
jgi:hypothetical protein